MDVLKSEAKIMLEVESKLDLMYELSRTRGQRGYLDVFHFTNG